MPGFTWASPISGSGLDLVMSVAADHDGNSYFTGFSQSGVIKVGAQFFTNAAFFVGKHDPNGALLWVRSYPRSRGASVAVDEVGDVYVGGVFSTNNFNLDGTTNLIRSSVIGGDDGFIARLSPDGDLKWVRQVSTTNSGGIGGGIVAVSGSNVFAAFQCPGSARLGTATITNTGVALASFTQEGDLNSFIRVGEGIPDNVLSGIGSLSAATDSAVYAGGFFNLGSFTIGTNVFLNAGSGDAFLAKFWPDGTCEWARNLAGANGDSISCVQGLPDGSVVALGRCGGPASLAGTNLPIGMFLARFSAVGDLMWAEVPWNPMPTPALAVDSHTNLYVGGELSSLVPDPHPLGLVISKFNGNGVFQWWTNVLTAGSFVGGFNSVSSLAMDQHDGLVVGGSFGYATLQFPAITLTNAGSTDSFIARLATDAPQLRFEQGESSLHVSWPLAHGDFALEKSADFTNWNETAFSTNANAPFLESSNHLQSPHEYFRLRAR